MRSGSLPAKTLPLRAVAVAVRQPAHEMSLRLILTADTQHAAGRPAATGYSHTVARHAGIYPPARGRFAKDRATQTSPGLIRPDQAWRARRVI